MNAVISGIAIADYCNYDFEIIWPTNNWCMASFSDIFRNDYEVKNILLNELRDKVNDDYVMLHDNFGAEMLNTAFQSAYAHQDLESFEKLSDGLNKDIFYYPALIPDWIPHELIILAVKKLSFNINIETEVTNFIVKRIGKPFYGLHLRRTDLTVGLSDFEVLDIVSGYPGETFFVCSDDPHAETVAAAHKNVRRFEKNEYVNKRHTDKDWISETTDDDGRRSYGNMIRSRTSVIESAIDLIILAHSTIVGYSGSTFQSMARLIGENRPIIDIDRPIGVIFHSKNDIQRQLQQKLISVERLIQICNTIAISGSMAQAISILEMSLEYYEKSDLNKIFYSLGVFQLNQNRPTVATAYLLQVVNSEVDNFSALVHLSYAQCLVKNMVSSYDSLQTALDIKPQSVTLNEQLLIDFIKFEIKE